MMIAILAAAAAASASPLLQGEIHIGTPADRVRALYPAGEAVRHEAGRILIEDLAVSERCKADAVIDTAGGAVAKIEMRGEPALLGRCGKDMLEELLARHGKPASRKDRPETPFSRSKSTYVWKHGAMQLRYVHYTSAGYAGSGLASASWVLTASGGAAE